jgi:hypothetical protein
LWSDEEVRMNDLQVAKGLGIFSVALGLTQLAAPTWLGQKTGTGAHPALMRACGVRELAAGVGVLSGRKPARALWARVVGDVIDLGLLGVSLVRSVRRGRVAFSLAMVIGVSLLDRIYARRLQSA